MCVDFSAIDAVVVQVEEPKLANRVPWLLDVYGRQKLGRALVVVDLSGAELSAGSNGEAEIRPVGCPNLRTREEP